MFRSGCPTRKPSQRPVNKTPLLSASMAERAALMRSIAKARSYSGFAASPVESSIDNPATPVLTARATLAATFSALCAKPPSKSALTGRSAAPHSAVRCANASSRVTRLSAFPIDHAKPALVEASALNPRCCNALALPTSQGLGSTKQPASCNFRNVARLSTDVIGMISPFFWLRHDSPARHVALVRVVGDKAVLRGLGTIVHAVIPDYAGNAQPVVFENRRPALGLAFAMLRHITPCCDGGFIAEERQRQDLALFGQAFKPFDRDKAIDGFQNRLQLGGNVEVFPLVLGLRPDFENYGDHFCISLAHSR